MTEVYFYHLERQPLERVLPLLLQRARSRGWRAVVRTALPERVAKVSELLWTFEDDSFLAHGSAEDGAPELQPIWLTALDERPNDADVLFLIDGAPASDLEGLVRAVVMFDGADQSAVEQARATWKALRVEGHAVSYWQQDGDGRWADRAKASTGS